MYTPQVGRTTVESYGGRASDISRMHNAFLRGRFFGKPATKTRYYIIISCAAPGIVRLLSDIFRIEHDHCRTILQSRKNRCHDDNILKNIITWCAQRAYRIPGIYECIYIIILYCRLDDDSFVGEITL